jgi:hypothetical protein
MNMDFDMTKNAEFDNNFSYATKGLTEVNNMINNDFLLMHNNMRDLNSGRDTDNQKKVVYVENNCEAENKVINDQSKQILSLLVIINSYQKESLQYKQQKDLYNKTYGKSEEFRRMINILIMIFILILIITMLYIHKHRII